ncbi:hypothetical protein THICB1_200066 [Thiomonas arsenitoxydans]|uniref:Uncharacterized protein n=1 Tax=Thiomonas arsenitoxydans (strain DSM 22701 / CIP 110005 / 3As) TaxID=426114 RepID=A0ABM9T520_THIA3|nr:hypothetical protein THICB1_200066 [Thiomonas arsenitoxydans]
MADRQDFAAAFFPVARATVVSHVGRVSCPTDSDFAAHRQSFRHFISPAPDPRGAGRGFRHGLLNALNARSAQVLFLSALKFWGAAIGSIEDGEQLGANLIHEVSGQALDLAATARQHIEGARLRTQDNPGGLGASARKRDGETRRAGKVAAVGDRHDDRRFHHPVEFARRHDQHRAHALLFVPRSGIERNQIDVAPFHQMTSSPTAGASSHSRAAALSGAEGSHCARSASRVYRRAGAGCTTSRPASTCRPTLAPACRCSRSSMTGGTVSMTEPPTRRKVVVCIASSKGYTKV